MLKLGKMTSKELAEWFGISYNTYSKKIASYKKQLENYARFKSCYGGVEVLEIFPDAPVEHNQSARQFVREKVPQYWPPNTWNSGGNVGGQIYNDYPSL